MKIEGLDTLVLGGGATTPCVYIVMAMNGRPNSGDLQWVFADRGAAEAEAAEIGGGTYVTAVAVDTNQADTGEEQ